MDTCRYKSISDPNGYPYDFNPCYGFSVTGCTNTVVSKMQTTRLALCVICVCVHVLLRPVSLQVMACMIVVISQREHSTMTGVLVISSIRMGKGTGIEYDLYSVTTLSWQDLYSVALSLYVLFW